MKTTVFSIDPNTGLPYMTPEQAIYLAKVHISQTSKNLLKHHNYTIDDLAQEILVKMASVEYDPTKSAAKTFFFLCATTCLGNIHRRDFKNNDRYKCGSDFVMFDNEGEKVMASELLGVEHITPHDYLEALETISQNKEIIGSSTRLKGWGGFRNRKTKDVT